jgi:Uma2 family endonuclease
MNDPETTLPAEPTSAGGIILLQNIRWSTYEALLDDMVEQPGKRLNYDRGLLEIMATSAVHERIKKLIGRFIDLTTLELDIDVGGYGSTTWKREDLQRGFESDECYYLRNEKVVRGRDHIDLTRDPPPDLVLEIDISRSSLKRQGIYAAFGVPEAWRFDGEKVRFYELSAEGSYEEIETSAALLSLSAGDLNRFLARRTSVGETSLMRDFRDWVRENLRQ